MKKCTMQDLTLSCTFKLCLMLPTQQAELNGSHSQARAWERDIFMEITLTGDTGYANHYF